MSNDQIQFFPGGVKSATRDFKSADLWKVPPLRLHHHPRFNVRIKDKDYEKRVRELADSMKVNGYYNDKPMAGYVAKEGDEDVIIITDGYTRHDAVLLAISEGAQIEVVPVVTKPSGTSMEDLTVALVTSNNGNPLKPYEIALVCKRLVDYGMDEETIATRLGYTLTHVQNLLFLMAAPAGVRKMVEQDKVSASLAVDTLRKHGSQALDILKAAAQEASNTGGVRVTPKQVSIAREKKSGERVVKLPKPALVKSVGWLKDQGLHKDPAVLKFLSFLAGMPNSDDVKSLVDDLLKPKAGKKSVKNSSTKKGGEPVSQDEPQSSGAQASEADQP